MKPPSITHHLTRAELDTAIRLYVGSQRGIDLTKANSAIRVKSRVRQGLSETGTSFVFIPTIVGAEVTIKAK
jgi:hypothetical protein